MISYKRILGALNVANDLLRLIRVTPSLRLKGLLYLNAVIVNHSHDLKTSDRKQILKSWRKIRNPCLKVA